MISIFVRLYMASSELGRPSIEGQAFHSGIGVINAAQERFFDAERSGTPHLECNGFKGVMAEEISQWQRRGLGRAFGFHSASNTDGYIFNYTESEKFHGVMYSLPLTESTVQGADKQVLLVAPNLDQGRYVVIAPTVALSEITDETQRINSVFLRRFNSLFSPNKLPYLYPQWENIGINPFDHFLQHPVDMSVDIVEILRGTDREKVLEQSLDVAMKEEIRRGINGDSITLLERFSDSDVRFFDELSTQFDVFVGPMEREMRNLDS